MAFDGSVIACITNELNKKILGGRIIKIAQPEKDELLLTIKNGGEQHRLLISVNASLPMIYFVEKNITSPLSAPSFCMHLRKHIQNGVIKNISQPGLERIINFEIEHFNEMGDLTIKVLAVELMGKHSNMILLDGDKISDSIKHVSSFVSSVREVIPGRPYFIPFADDKFDPLEITETKFIDEIFKDNLPLSKALFAKLSGISPDISKEILYRAGVDSDITATAIDDIEKEKIFSAFSEVMDIIRECSYDPAIYYTDDEPVFYGVFDYKLYNNAIKESYDSILMLLYSYYEQRRAYTSIRQKTKDLRQILTGLIAKDNKKYDLQIKQLKDTEKKDKFKLYGELLTAYGYNVEPKATSMKAIDYNTDEEITIPLDPTLSAIENGKRYFDKYSKMKRTADALSEIAVETKAEIEHLESILSALDMSQNEADIDLIKQEMSESGYIKRRSAKDNGGKKKTKTKDIKSAPLHYVSSEGFDFYVGKNNYQNEEVTFKIASSEDWWFHAKGIPGSHVIIKANGKEVSDKAFEDAARLAAYYSKANSKDAKNLHTNVEIDYIQRKFLKKTPGARPGFVIYHKNYSMSAKADISELTEIS